MDKNEPISYHDVENRNVPAVALESLVVGEPTGNRLRPLRSVGHVLEEA